jgi:dihydrofolate reductase
MAKVSFDISISLDGFITADGWTPENPLGNGGHQLHEWYFQADQEMRDKIPASQKNVGAIICGKVTYETSAWGENGPHPPTPVFVVTDEVEAPPVNSVYTFVPDIESAVREAKKTAGDRDVRIMGGAYTGKTALRAGLVDEVVVHIVPVLFGKGKPLFGDWDDTQRSLEILEVMHTPLATHIRYEVVK